MQLAGILIKSFCNYICYKTLRIMKLDQEEHIVNVKHNLFCVERLKSPADLLIPQS